MTQERKQSHSARSAPTTSVAWLPETAVLSGASSRMTRGQWRTKCRRRPRRGAESLPGSIAVESVRVERRVSPPPRRGTMFTFRPSLHDQISQGTAKRPMGVAAVIIVVRPQGFHSMSTTKPFRALARPPPTLRTPLFASHDCQFTTTNYAFSGTGDRCHWRQ
jgi:hypothetical protein